MKTERLIKDTAAKAGLIVGLGPITAETLKHFEDTETDHETAKSEAVKEFLGFYLKYGDEELERLEIKATQIATKDDIVYVALGDASEIRDIYVRAAQCKHPEVKTRNFVPPQFFDRYMYLSKKCTEMRNESGGTIKTQMRFGKEDIEVLTKKKGSTEGYKLVQLSTVSGGEQIPLFNDEIKWRKKSTWQHGERLKESPARGRPPSMIQKEMLTHSRSSSVEGAPKKKSRSEFETNVYKMDGKNVA